MLIVSGTLMAQNGVNQVDAQGRKQGFWTKKDAQGRLLYQATFKDDLPVGEMKRFHPNGKIKALMNFTEGSKVSEAKLFDELGHKIAEGKYLNQKKTGEWNYFLNDKIVGTENYENGEKNGLSKRWFSTGQLLEEANWKNGKLDGMYRTYFQNGKVYLECKYKMGLRNGPFKTFFTDGTPELDAFYTNDVQDKSWLYYNEKGELLYTLKYDKGVLLNPEVQDSINAARVDAFKTKEDNIPDPEKYMQNPEEYMRLMEERKGK
jgi:antitoxin component YwqK of YwqJK toxin-antitoxin module